MVTPKSSLKKTVPPKTLKKTTSPAKKAQPKQTPAASVSLIDALVASLKLDAQTITTRALQSFAIAHGLPVTQDLPPSLMPPVIVTSSLTKGTPMTKSETTSSVQESAAEEPLVRLYIHDVSTRRPPQEMIPDRYVIGSGQKNEMWVNAPQIETKHLCIERRNNRYFVFDMNTAKGSLINSEPLLNKHEIEHEDIVRMAGYHAIKFYIVKDT